MNPALIYQGDFNMVTCRQLMELDVFYNLKQMAGKNGLDREVTWIYAKNTPSIVPWVEGGEFVMVSGYDTNMREDDLLRLLGEAEKYDISGILLEGGINFKELPQSVISKADKNNIPLFFVKGVVSFLEISREIASLIADEHRHGIKYDSLMEKLIRATSSGPEEVRKQLLGTHISTDNCFMLAVFNVDGEALKEKSTLALADATATS